MKIANYAIHDIIKFQIKNSTGLLKMHCDTTSLQFQSFLADKEPPYDFTVEIGPFLRENISCAIIDDTYRIAKDYIYFKDSRKLSKWEVELSDIETLPRVRIASNFVGNITTPLNIIEFLIQYCLLKKGISVLHASSVGKGKEASIFAARGGGGKTTTALSLVNKGFTYFGDNFIILTKGTIKSYISPLNIFSYNRLPVLEKSFSRKQKLSLAIKQTFYNLTGGYYKIFEKVNPRECFTESIRDEADVKGLLFLQPCNLNTIKNLDFTPIEYNQAIKKLRYNMELDLNMFNKYIYSYGYVFPNSVFGKFWEIYEENLRKNLPKECLVSIVHVPMKYDDQYIKDLSEKTDCLVKEKYGGCRKVD